MSEATKEATCRICGGETKGGMSLCVDCDVQGSTGAEVIGRIREEVGADWVLRQIVRECLRDLYEEREAVESAADRLDKLSALPASYYGGGHDPQSVEQGEREIGEVESTRDVLRRLLPQEGDGERD